MSLPVKETNRLPQEYESKSRGGIHALLSLLLSSVVLLLFSGLANAALCPDNDKDGYVVCNDCELPDGKSCGECNDANPNIRPGVAEFCGDGIDNNCDNVIDFGAGLDCTIGFPDNCEGPTPDQPCCLTHSILVCNAEGTGVICPTPETGLEQPVLEVAYSETCHDGIDNDCDTLIDGLDGSCSPTEGELCNGIDDDYDGEVDNGFFVGDPCTAGIGECEREGVLVCDKPTTTLCSASPGTAQSENTPGIGVCVDNKDNDCDGFIDVADSGCSAPEICDGKDNDGNQLVDEGFDDLGEPCVSGLGQCQNEGIMICSPDGLYTTCSATPNLASAEGPTGPTCEDGIDNDCDGFADIDDPDCSSADFAVSCSLPYAEPWWAGFYSCVGLHKIRIFSNVDLEKNPDVTLTAELWAMDKDGTILASIPVQDGDYARLGSRIDKEDWYVESLGINHKVFAPRPVLHVALDDGKKKAEAFCSNIPFLQVMEPKGKVVAESEGDFTRLQAAIPLVAPSTVDVQVDGVDIFASLGISNPASCFPTTPCGGTMMMNGRAVEITDIVVQSSFVGIPGINTVTMQLGNLGCGEHIFKVTGVRRLWSFPNTPDEQCLIDDIADLGTSSGISIDISSPDDMEVVAEGSVHVTGYACSGREISDVAVNGKLVDLSGMVFTMGDGLTSGDKYEVDIDAIHDITDLSADVTSGDTKLGTFDKGSNRLSAQVTDDLGNRSFDSKIFAVGNTAMPSLKADLEAALQGELYDKVKTAAESAAQELDNAFVVGMSKDAIQDLFDKRCKAAGTEFVNNLQAKIVNTVVDERKVEVTACSCDPTVKTRISGFSADPNAVSCPVDFQNDQMKVSMNLPAVHIDLSVGGSCRVEDPIFGACIAKTNVSGSTSTDLTASRLEFTITEGQLLGISDPPDPLYFPPTASEPPTGNIHVSIGCLASVCDFFLTPFAAIVNAIAGDRLIPVLGFGQTIDVNFEADLGSSVPDPINLAEIKVDEQEVQGTGQKLEGVLSSVSITPNGLVAGLVGKFETLSIDPEVETTPGAVATPAPIPTIPVAGAGEIFMGLADDTFNQFFASMAVSGRFKTGCEDTGKTLGDLLPIDCETLSVGQCSEDATVSCSSDSDCSGTCTENALKTAVAKGSCFAFKGFDCSTLPLGQKLVCLATEQKLDDINIHASQPLLFCARQDVPPRLLIHDEAATPDVETTVRLNDMSFALIVDRDGDGQLAGELPAAHKCLAEGAPTVGDCNFFGACLDLNIQTGMQLATKQCANDSAILCTTDTDCASVGGTCVDVCDSGDPGFVTRVISVQPTIRSLGVVCGGATTSGDDDLIANTSGQDTTMDLVLENANRFTPPTCIQGLTLGDFVEFKNPKLFTIETDGDPAFEDYLGLTGDVQ
ncbi:MAG: hypothetical protein KQH63_11335 [Desulfobulbaceae bacterium]|nr:hypothetical protein [Desulfobulbaceae bacterium]